METGRGTITGIVLNTLTKIWPLSACLSLQILYIISLLLSHCHIECNLSVTLIPNTSKVFLLVHAFRCFDREFYSPWRLTICLCVWNRLNAVNAQNTQTFLEFQCAKCWNHWTHARLSFPPCRPFRLTHHTLGNHNGLSQESTLYFSHDCLLPFTTSISFCSSR